MKVHILRRSETPDFANTRTLYTWDDGGRLRPAQGTSPSMSDAIRSRVLIAGQCPQRQNPCGPGAWARHNATGEKIADVLEAAALPGGGNRPLDVDVFAHRRTSTKHPPLCFRHSAYVPMQGRHLVCGNRLVAILSAHFCGGWPEQADLLWPIEGPVPVWSIAKNRWSPLQGRTLTNIVRDVADRRLRIASISQSTVE